MSQPDAWDRFVSLYQPFILGFLRQRGICADDAEDVTQNVLEVVIRELPTFQHNKRDGAFRNWLCQVTTNCLKSFGRGEKRAPKTIDGLDYHELAIELGTANSDLRRMWDEEHNAHVLNHLINIIESEFKPTTVRAFKLVGINGQNVAEAAKDLDVTENAVRIAIHRVSTRLRELGRGLTD